MELKQIKELMAAMGRTGMKSVFVKKDGFELKLERTEDGRYLEVPPLEGTEDNPMRADMEQHRSHAFLSKGPAKMAAPMPLEAPAPAAEGPGVFITSPMVGTFYAATAPEDPPFIKVGDRVEKGTVVCIVEAMKVMNEVKAGVTGTIAEVLVDNGQPIEFGTKMFRVIP